MQIKVLGAYGGSTPQHRQTSFLIDDRVALDAGALTESLSLEAQAKVRAILLTHSHMDHVASLPFLVENVFGRAEGPIEVLAPPEVVSSLKTHLFNDDLWPDFTRIPNHLLPTFTFRAIEARKPIQVHGLTVVAIPVFHVVPTFGYVISDGKSAVVFSGDTGATDELWEVARREPNLKAIFVECSFPDEMERIAEISRHFTPKTLHAEMVKFPPIVPVNLYHMKPPTLLALRGQVAALAEARITLLDDGDTLDY